MRHFRLIIRQARRASKQAALFMLCTALSLTTLTAFNGFALSVSRSLLDDARTLHAADILIKSYDPISKPLDQAIDQLVATQSIERSNLYEMISVVRTLDEKASVLAALKVATPGYPFYGKVGLASGRRFQEVLAPGTCIVAQSLVDRMGIRMGDRLKVGYTTLTVVDVVLAEPDRPVTFFSFGARVFVHGNDLDTLGLISKRGRIRRTVLLKVQAPEQINEVARQLKQIALPDQERVDTFQTAGSRIKRFMENFFFFLKLVGLFILLVAGLGIQGTLTALLKEKQPTIAIMKTVGATNRYIWRHFTMMTAMMGLAGTVLGILCGLVIQWVLGGVMAPYLPTGLKLAIAWAGVLESAAVGLVVVTVFSFLPLYRIKAMRPMMIFRKPTALRSHRGPDYLSVGLILVFFFGLVLRHTQEWRFGLYFVGGIVVLVLIAALLTQLLLWTLARRPIHNLAIRQAVKGLFRKGNATRATIITLTVSLAVIFANHLIEKNLDSAFVRSFPKGSPNTYFVDIQSDQRKAFLQEVGHAVAFYPIIRARVSAINGTPINRQAERQKRRDNFSRIFNLTYRHHLLEDEALAKGKALFRKNWSVPQVSILDTVAEMHPMDVGDTLTFKIQGVPLKARIASIRTRSRSSFSPFFYFVFPETILAHAPQTFFAAMKVPPEKLGDLQNRIVARLPNVSVIDLSHTIATFTQLMNRLSKIIRSFSFFSIAAGLLILASAIYATRAERIVEAVYYKILGAETRFVLKVFALENLLIGLLAGLPALVMAQLGAYYICTQKLEIDYHLFFFSSGTLVAATAVLVLVVGLTASRSIMAKRPAVYLREQNDA